MNEDVIRPNIVLILADDLGHDDLAFYGNNYVETPVLDNLADKSLCLENFTVNPVCAPSRASLLTGRHFLRTGVAHVHGGREYLALDEVTIADILSANGYATGMWGKWHNGTCPGYLPWERGFQEAMMFQLYRHRSPVGINFMESRAFTDSWGDAVMVDKAIDFISRHRDRPFFAFLPTMTPHGPLDAPDELVEHYRAKGLSDNLAQLYAMVDFMDRQIGRILKALDEFGVADNTIVLFLSDNGPAFCDNMSDSERAIRKVGGLRGWKGDIWENGVHSPLFVRWPDKLKSGKSNLCCDMTDLMPTLLEWTGIDLPENHKKLDGISLVRAISEENPDEMFKSIFNYADKGWPPSKSTPYIGGYGRRSEYNPIAPEDKAKLRFADQVVSLVEGKWKLLLNPSVNDRVDPVPEYVLVDLGNDPGERDNLASVYPERVSGMRRKLKDWFLQIQREDNSFLSPVHKVEYATNGDYIIPARNALRLSANLCNGIQWLGFFEDPGDRAEYTVIANSRSRCKISLRFHTEPPSDWRFTVGFGSVGVIVYNNGEEWISEEFLDINESKMILFVELVDAPGVVQHGSFPELEDIVMHIGSGDKCKKL